jgi:hypothetical protein
MSATYRTWFILLTAFQVGDVLSTWLALSIGISEGNPIVIWVTSKLGFWFGSFVMKSLCMAWFYCFRSPLVYLCLTAIMMSVVDVLNLTSCLISLITGDGQ